MLCVTESPVLCATLPLILTHLTVILQAVSAGAERPEAVLLAHPQQPALLPDALPPPRQCRPSRPPALPTGGAVG